MTQQQTREARLLAVEKRATARLFRRFQVGMAGLYAEAWTLANALHVERAKLADERSRAAIAR